MPGLTQDHQYSQDQEPDAALIAQAGKGDSHAFGILVERYFQAVFATAFAHLRQIEAAEELTQEVFLRAYLNLGSVRRPSYFPVWVHRIARNLALDWLRTGKLRSELMQMVPFDEIDPDALPDRNSPSPRDLAEQGQQRRHLHAAILSLPDGMRETVLLHFSQELTKAEIARRMNCDRTTVGRHLDQALAMLRKQFGKDLDALSRTACLPGRRAVSRASAIALVVAAMPPSASSALASAAVATTTPGLASASSSLANSVFTGGTKMLFVKALAALGGVVTFVTAANTLVQEPHPAPISDAPLVQRQKALRIAESGAPAPRSEEPRAIVQPSAAYTTDPQPGGTVSTGPHWLAGRISLLNGDPIPGATINTYTTGALSLSKKSVVSGPDGKYRLEGLANRPHLVRAVHPRYGYIGSVREVDVDQDGINFTSDGQVGFTYIGHVIDAKTQFPITDFEVTSRHRQIFRKDPTEPGSFLAENLQGGEFYQFDIRARDYAPHGAEFTVTPQTPLLNVTFALGEGGTVTGRLVDAKTSQPCAGARVVLIGNDTNIDTPGRSPEGVTTTTRDGRFRFDRVPVFRNWITIEPPSPLAAQKRTFTMGNGGKVDLGDIALSPGGRVHGRIVSDDDTAVDGLKVTLRNGSSVLPVDLVTTSSRDGRFEFTDLIDDKYTVAAEAGAVKSAVQVRNGEAPEVELSLGGTDLTGTITYGRIPSVTWGTLTLQNDPSPEKRSILSNSAGAYEVKALRRGMWKVQIHGPDKQVVHEELLAINGDEGTIQRNFALAPCRILGRVVDKAGDAVSSATVLATQMPVGGTMTPGTVVARTITDQEGGFVLDRLTTKTYCLTATRHGLGSAVSGEVSIGPSGDSLPQELSLSGSGGTLVSVALHMQTGKPMESAWCSVLGPKGPFAHNQIRDKEGVVTITDIPVGSYRVQVSTWGHSISERVVNIDDRQTTQIEDVLYPAGSLRWRLVDSQKEPLAGVVCTITPDNPESVEQPRTGSTDASGVLIVRGLMPSTYTATATPQGKMPVSHKFSVGAAALAVHETTVP